MRAGIVITGPLRSEKRSVLAAWMKAKRVPRVDIDAKRQERDGVQRSVDLDGPDQVHSPIRSRRAAAEAMRRRANVQRHREDRLNDVLQGIERAREEEFARLRVRLKAAQTREEERVASAAGAASWRADPGQIAASARANVAAAPLAADPIPNGTREEVDGQAQQTSSSTPSIVALSSATKGEDATGQRQDGTTTVSPSPGEHVSHRETVSSIYLKGLGKDRSARFR